MSTKFVSTSSRLMILIAQSEDESEDVPGNGLWRLWLWLTLFEALTLVDAL